MTASAINVMLVDDHPVVRSGYARLVEQAGDMRVVAEAGSEDRAMAVIDAGLQPHVLVTDLAMPGGGYGLNLIARVRARRPQCRAIVFSMYESEPLVRQAMKAGASGYLSKRSAPHMLVQAVRAVHSGLQAVSPEHKLTAEDAMAGRDAAKVAALSPREFRLFELLAKGHPISECARQLDVSAKTASNQQALLREKLGVSTSAGMAHLALRCGLIRAARE